jgi:hypothetical protein
MTMQFEETLRVIESFNSHGVMYVVVGGVAMNVHGFVRATEDLDVLVKPDPDNIRRLRETLRDVWADPEIDGITAEDLCGDYPAVRYGPPRGNLYLDILTKLGELVSYDDIETEQKTMEGVVVRVATPRSLYRMKQDTPRHIDKADPAVLREAYDLEDEES